MFCSFYISLFSAALKRFTNNVSTAGCETTNNKNRFPNSKREEWEKIFPSFTTKEEIGLVDGLVKYNPKQRLTAAEVSALET